VLPEGRGLAGRPYQVFPDPAVAPPILRILQDVAARRPDDVAIEDTEGALTFADLMRGVASLAARLLQAPDGAVAVLPSTGAAYGIATFAALAASRVSVLLDAGYPEARNAALAEATGATIVLIGHQAAPDWSGVTAMRAERAPDTQIRLPPFMDLDAPAFILCTSGSSGRPRPIVHSQRTMLHWVRASHNALRLNAEDRVLSLSSLSTLGGFTALLGYPLAGATVQVLDLKAAGLGGLLSVLRDRPVTVLRSTPSLLRGIAGLPGARDALGRLRVVQTFGEPLMKPAHAEISAILPPGCLFRTTYGSTEASGMSWHANGTEPHDPFRIPAGTLLPDTLAAIRDEDGRPCRYGEPGELWISSRYNALGEWRGGALAQGPFEADPAHPGHRIFRTGDLAVTQPDGVFVVLGRADRMVKINGQRLEPAEIEAAMLACDGVDQAHVVVQRRDHAAASLIAFIVAAVDSPPDLVTTVRRALRLCLPPFMVPARFVLVAGLPLLPGGKIDQAALLGQAERAPC
jgi:acyl-coenzyme A synthetase/AMP-(fatty) acid ligase